MTLVACPPLYLPDPNYFNAGIAPILSSTLLDATTDRAGAVFLAPKTGNIRKISVRFGMVPALNAASTLTIGLQDVSLTDGNPDGTFDQSATIPNGSILADTTYKATLGADRAVTRGDLVAVVVQFNAFTAGDQVNIAHFTNQPTRGGPFQWGYPVQNVTGSYARVNPAMAVFSIEYDDGSYAYIPSLWPVAVGNSVSYNSGSTPDEIGLRFQVPFACKLGGCHVGIDQTGDFQLNLYSAAGRTVVEVMDKDAKMTATNMTSPIMFTAEQTLAANTAYVLALEPTSVTNITLGYLDVATVAELDQLPTGQQLYYATAKNPSTTADFSLTTTRRPTIGLIITAVDDGVGINSVVLGTSVPRRFG